jgi:hypothetical protein
LFLLGSLTFDGLFECFDYVLRPLFSRKLYMNLNGIG